MTITDTNQNSMDVYEGKESIRGINNTELNSFIGFSSTRGRRRGTGSNRRQSVKGFGSLSAERALTIVQSRQSCKFRRNTIIVNLTLIDAFCSV